MRKYSIKITSLFVCAMLLVSIVLPIGAEESINTLNYLIETEFDGNFNSPNIQETDEGYFIYTNNEGETLSYIVPANSTLNYEMFGNENYENGPMTRSVWTKGLKFMVWVLKKGAELVVGSCLDGGNICKTVIGWLIHDAPYNSNNLVAVSRWSKYTPGKIPGCVPMNSGVCNTGYWEYKVVYAG